MHFLKTIEIRRRVVCTSLLTDLVPLMLLRKPTRIELKPEDKEVRLPKPYMSRNALL